MATPPDPDRDDFIVEAAIHDNRPATRGFVTGLLDHLMDGLGTEMVRTQLQERQLNATAIGALTTMLAEVETQHLAEVTALHAEVAGLRAEVERAKGKGTPAAPTQPAQLLKVVR